MHLKFEGKWVYLLIIPAIVLATILVLALVPDQALKPAELESEESARVIPTGASPGVRVALVVQPSMSRLDRTSRGID